MIAPDLHFSRTRSGVHLKRIKNYIWELLGLQRGRYTRLIRDFNDSVSTDQPFFRMKKKDWSHLQLSSIGPREEHRQRTRSIVEAFHDMELALD